MAEITLDKIRIAGLLRKRAADSHKGTYGHALIVAGSPGKVGAAIIAARACLRSGAGLLTVSVPKSERAALLSSIPEAMLVDRDDYNEMKYSAAGVGPGIGSGKEARRWLKKFLRFQSTPTVFDADALNIMSQEKEMFKALSPATLITPHPKEFDRLFGPSSSTQQREEKALQLSINFAGVMILKGHRTIVAHNGVCYRNTSGNAGLAKGGSGDMLTGMLTAFLAQGYTVLESAQLGVFLHGLAADITLGTQSVESMLATDVIENIGAAFKEVS